MEKGVPGEKPRTCTVDRAQSAGDTHEFGQSTAVMTLLMVVGPDEIMSLLRSDLIPPTPGVPRHWTCIVYPSTRDARKKTGMRIDSVLVSWIGPVHVLHQGDPAHCVFSLTCGEY